MKRQKSWRVSPKGKAMTTAADSIAEAQFKLRELARPMWTDTREGSLARVARAIGLTRSAAERIVYRKCKRIDAHVMDNIRAAYDRLEARAERLADLQLDRARAAQGAFDAVNSAPDSSGIGMGRQKADPGR